MKMTTCVACVWTPCPVILAVNEILTPTKLQRHQPDFYCEHNLRAFAAFGSSNPAVAVYIRREGIKRVDFGLETIFPKTLQTRMIV